jgi:transcription elongation factor Elf1
MTKVECEDCGESLNLSVSSKPLVDWREIVCSNCGNFNAISMIRLSREVKSQ